MAYTIGDRIAAVGFFGSVGGMAIWLAATIVFIIFGIAPFQKLEWAGVAAILWVILCLSWMWVSHIHDAESQLRTTNKEEA